MSNEGFVSQERIFYTLNDGQQDNNDEEKESNIKDHSIKLVFISSWVFNLISNASACSDTHIHVEQITL